MGEEELWHGGIEYAAGIDASEGKAEDFGLTLSVPQYTIFSDVARFKAVVAGRRFGKTFLAIPELLAMAWGDGREAWYVAPTYKMAKQIVWRPLKKLLGPYIASKNETDLSVELKCGGRIALRGAENYDALRGPGLNGLILDEAADIASEAWFEALRPMLADRQGRALFIGTPKGFNWFYDLWRRAKDGEPGWKAWQYTTLQGGNVPPDEIEAARRDMDVKTFRQEFEASFENLGAGRVYYAFEREGNIGATEFDPALPLCWSMDFNINPMCSVLCQVQGERVTVLEELYLPDCSTHEACAVFDERAEKYRARLGGSEWNPVAMAVNVYGDASGANRQHAGPSDWAIIKDYAKRVSNRFKMDFRLRSANPAVKDRVAAVNATLCNAAGERRLIISPAAKELIADLERVQWKADSAGNLRSELDGSDMKRTHISDALGYLVEKEFGLREKGGWGSTRIV